MPNAFNYEPTTLTPNWSDRARDAYWSHPTKAQAVALFLTAVALGSAAVALI